MVYIGCNRNIGGNRKREIIKIRENQDEVKMKELIDEGKTFTVNKNKRVNLISYGISCC